MMKHPDFTIQALSKIGAPLAAALESVAIEAEDVELESAKRMAQMLGQVVQMSIGLSGQIGTPATEEEADSLRAGAAALAANLVADFYRHHEKIPEEQDIGRMTKILEAVLAFADNFSASAEQASGRLMTMGASEPIFDQTQANLVTLQALTPVIAAIGEFPFGLSETKLLQDVSTKLDGYTKGVVSDDDSLSQMLVFRSLADLYAECHKAETARLASASDDDRGELSIDPVWTAFETRLAMVEALFDVPQAESSASPAAPTPAPAQQDQEATPPPQAEAPAPAAPAGGGGPMGFFAGGGDNAPAENSAPQADQPVAQQPAAEAPAATSETPPAVAGGGGPMGFFAGGGDNNEQPPVAENPAPTEGESEEDEEGKRSGGSGGGGNKPAATNNQKAAPMSFFKPPSGGGGM